MMKIKNSRHLLQHAEYFWVAANQSAVPMFSIPSSFHQLQVSPVPEQLFGFPTLEEAREAQRVLLNEPMSAIRQMYKAWESRPEVATVMLAEPEEPVFGAPTMWAMGK